MTQLKSIPGSREQNEQTAVARGVDVFIDVMGRPEMPAPWMAYLQFVYMSGGTRLTLSYPARHDAEKAAAVLGVALALHNPVPERQEWAAELPIGDTCVRVCWYANALISPLTSAACYADAARAMAALMDRPGIRVPCGIQFYSDRHNGHLQTITAHYAVVDELHRTARALGVTPRLVPHGGRPRGAWNAMADLDGALLTLECPTPDEDGGPEPSRTGGDEQTEAAARTERPTPLGGAAMSQNYLDAHDMLRAAGESDRPERLRQMLAQHGSALATLALVDEVRIVSRQLAHTCAHDVEECDRQATELEATRAALGTARVEIGRLSEMIRQLRAAQAGVEPC